VRNARHPLVSVADDSGKSTRRACLPRPCSSVHLGSLFCSASFGRVNSLYVRADMTDARTNRLARLQNPQIIVHNTGPDGSLRGAAMALGKPAVTIEIGNPQVLPVAGSMLHGYRASLSCLVAFGCFSQSFHDSYIEKAYVGVENTLVRAGLVILCTLSIIIFI
jgi:hypothetical protein